MYPFDLAGPTPRAGLGAALHLTWTLLADLLLGIDGQNLGFRGERGPSYARVTNGKQLDERRDDTSFRQAAAREITRGN